MIARLDIDDNLRGDQVKSLVSGIESALKLQSEDIYRVDVVPIGGPGTPGPEFPMGPGTSGERTE